MRQARVPYDGLSSEGVQRISAAADGLGVARVAGLCAPRRAPARAHLYRSSSRYQPLPPERRHPQDAMGLPVECQTPFECQNGRIWRRDERGSNPRSRDRDCPHVGSIMIADVPMRRTSSRMRLRRASASVANVCRRWYGPLIRIPAAPSAGYYSRLRVSYRGGRRREWS